MKKRIDLENSKKLYYSLKEVANHFDVNESLLRYWEKEFKIINPRKTPGGTRQYTKEDITNIEVVYHLVKTQGMTLEGARLTLQKKYEETEQNIEVIRKLENIKLELRTLTRMFDSVEKEVIKGEMI